MKRLILLIVLLFTINITGQIVIKNGDATEGFNSVLSDHTIGNPCGEPNFMNIFYNGNYKLPGNIVIWDAVVTIHGEVDYNGFTVALDCPNAEFIVTGETLSIPETTKNNLMVYPNPTEGLFYVTTKQAFSVRVYDLSGKLVAIKPDLRGLSSGFYLVSILIDGVTITKKIIKR